MRLCWFCGTEAALPGKITRDSVCSKCRISLKCCRNCRFYDPASHNQCREPAAEWVRDKELANFCEFFDFAERSEGARPGRDAGGKQKFDSLFKK
jgi:hypothetical protein